MKNFKQKNILLIIVLGLASCGVVHLDTDNSGVNAIDKYKNSYHAISLKETKVLKKNYDTRFLEKIKEIQLADKKRSNGAYDPTEYLWISLEDMKSYIKFLEAVEKKNPNNPDISGIAINFGAYDLDKNVEKEDKKRPVPRSGDYAGRLSVYFSPTFVQKGLPANDIKNHKPFYIHYNGPDHFKGEYRPLANIYSGEAFNESVANLKPKKSNTSMKTANGFQQNAASTTFASGDQSANSNDLNSRPPYPKH